MGFLMTIINMSLAGSIVILVVMLCRVPLRKAPKVFSYALWGTALFRLLCPVSLPARFSALSPFARAPDGITAVFISNDPGQTVYPQVSLPADNAAAVSLAQGPGQPQVTFQPVVLLWLCGCAAVLLYGGVSVLLLRRRLVGRVKLQGNIYLADHIPSPFVLGIIRPKIYLPSGLSEAEQAIIILHEQTHIRRLDHLTRLLGFIALALHWFNPFVWAAYFLSERDMEMSCDEAVVRKLTAGSSADYADTLLRLSAGRRRFPAPPAFGEGNIKMRIKNVLRCKKPARWVLIAAALLVIAVGAVCITNPVADGTRTTSLTFPYYEDEKTAYNAEIFARQVRVSFPHAAEWELRKAGEDSLLLSGAWSRVDIYDGDALIGTLGYNIIPQEADETDDPMAVYSQIALGNDYQFAVRDSYEAVRTWETGESALVDVYYAPGISDRYPDGQINRGVVAYDRETGTYVAFDLDAGLVTQQQARRIAEQLVLEKAN